MPVFGSKKAREKTTEKKRLAVFGSQPCSYLYQCKLFGRKTIVLCSSYHVYLIVFLSVQYALMEELFHCHYLNFFYPDHDL